MASFFGGFAIAAAMGGSIPLMAAGAGAGKYAGGGGKGLSACTSPEVLGFVACACGVASFLGGAAAAIGELMA